MKITHLTMPREARITWRRHLPAWVGLVHHGAGSRRRVSGLYLRTGDRMHLFEANWPYRQAREEQVNRLFRRVTALERTLDAAGVNRLPVPPKRG